MRTDSSGGPSGTSNGELICRIRLYKDDIAHYHTASNPGRSELDGTMQAIVETG